MKASNIAIYLTLSFGIAIAWGTLTPLDELPPVPGTDKLQHFVAFGVFVLPVSLLLPARTWLIFVIAVLYGGLIEIIQPYVNRYGELGDFWANTGGAVIGVVISRIILAQLKRKRAVTEKE